MLEAAARAVARGAGPLNNDVRRRARNAAMFRLRREWLDLAWARRGANDASVGRFVRARVAEAEYLDWDRLSVAQMRLLGLCECCAAPCLPAVEGGAFLCGGCAVGTEGCYCDREA